MKNVHPEIEIPVKVLYETDSEEGNIVTFYHNDHSSIFGYDCSDCHTQEACANCHAEFRLETISADIHDRCSNCHDTENRCNECHKSEVAKPFNHFIKTGFGLTNWHANIECISCHKTANIFSGLESDCEACHSDNEGIFKHSITGIELDDMHLELECTDCHGDSNYAKRPSCDACHDEDISYPNSIPGIRIK